MHLTKKEQVEALTISIKQLNPHQHFQTRYPTKAGRATLPLESIEVMQHYCHNNKLVTK